MQLCAINQRSYAGQDPAEDTLKEAAPDETGLLLLLCAPGMGDNSAVKVRYRLGSRNC
jgi:hypothetical protein